MAAGLAIHNISLELERMWIWVCSLHCLNGSFPSYATTEAAFVCLIMVGLELYGCVMGCVCMCAGVPKTAQLFKGYMQSIQSRLDINYIYKLRDSQLKT